MSSDFHPLVYSTIYITFFRGLTPYFLNLSTLTYLRLKSSDYSHEQCFLMSELESLGLSNIRLNEFNDNVELQGLIRRMKESFLKEYYSSRDDDAPAL